MRITFILPFAGLSGGSRVIAIYAEKLLARGHKVLIVSQPAQKVSLKTKIKTLILRKKISNSTESRPFFENTNIENIILDKTRPVEAKDVPDADIIVATFWITANWVDNLPSSKGAKCYLIQGHEVQPHFYNSTAEITYQLPLHKIVISRWLKNIMQESYGDYNADLVPNAVDFNHFKSDNRRKNKALTIGFLHSHKPCKNTALAIEIIVQAKREISNLKVVAFGAYPAKIPYALPEWIEFHCQPPQSKIPSLYSQCDAWLFTSEVEGFGLPILESMACGTPVLSTPAAAAPDLINPNNGALLDFTPVSFLKEINRFNKMSNEEWLEMSNNAIKVARKYSWDDAADLFEASLKNATVTEECRTHHQIPILQEIPSHS